MSPADDLDAVLARCQQLFDAGRYHQCAVDLASAVGGPAATSAPAYLLLGLCQQRMERFEEATDSLAHAAALDSENFAAYRGLGEIHASLKRWPESVDYFNQARALNSAVPGLLSQLGEACISLELDGGEGLAAARSAFEEARAADPDDLLATMGLGKVAVLEGDTARAGELISELGRAHKLQRNELLAFQQEHAKSRTQKIEPAVPAFQVTRANAPKSGGCMGVIAGICVLVAVHVLALVALRG